MSEATRQSTQMTVDGSVETTYAKILEALREGAIIRDEEDGVGRFAGVRTVVMQGRRGDRLLLMRGAWSELKKRVEDPMLVVELHAEGSQTRVELHGDPPKEPSGAEKAIHMLSDVVSVALLIGALAYAVNTIRGLGVDWPRLGMIAGGGAVLYTVAKQFMGGESEELEGAAWLRARVEAALSEGEGDSDGETAPPSDPSMRATVDD